MYVYKEISQPESNQICFVYTYIMYIYIYLSRKICNVDYGRAEIEKQGIINAFMG